MYERIEGNRAMTCNTGDRIIADELKEQYIPSSSNSQNISTFVKIVFEPTSTNISFVQ